MSCKSNTINLGSNGVVLVAIFESATFDVYQIANGLIGSGTINYYLLEKQEDI